MCSGKHVPNSLRSSAGLTFFVTLTLYIPFWLRRGLFPASWCTFSSSTQRSGTVEPAGVPWRGINPCSVLHSGVTCLFRIPISLQVTPKTHFCHCPLPSPPQCLPAAQFVAEQPLRIEPQSRWPLPGTREFPHRESCYRGTPFPLWAVLTLQGMKFSLKLLFVFVFFVENSMGEQSILWETFAILKKIRNFSGYCKSKQLIFLLKILGVYDEVFLLLKIFWECFPCSDIWANNFLFQYLPKTVEQKKYGRKQYTGHRRNSAKKRRHNLCVSTHL